MSFDGKAITKIAYKGLNKPININVPKRLFLGSQLGGAVCDFNAKDASLLDDFDSLSSRNVVGYFSGEGGVVHEKQVDLSRVVDHELLVAVGHQVAGLFVGSISDRRHGKLAFETSSDSVVNTFGFAPCLLNRCISVGLMPTDGRWRAEH